MITPEEWPAEGGRTRPWRFHTTSCGAGHALTRGHFPGARGHVAKFFDQWPAARRLQPVVLIPSLPGTGLLPFAGTHRAPTAWPLGGEPPRAGSAPMPPRGHLEPPLWGPVPAALPPGRGWQCSLAGGRLLAANCKGRSLPALRQSRSVRDAGERAVGAKGARAGRGRLLRGSLFTGDPSPTATGPAPLAGAAGPSAVGGGRPRLSVLPTPPGREGILSLPLKWEHLFRRQPAGDRSLRHVQTVHESGRPCYLAPRNSWGS